MINFRRYRLQTLILLLVVTSGFLLLQPVAADENLTLYTFNMRHRPAEVMVDTLIPLLAPNGRISASGNTLILKTTSANFNELVLLLEELDTPLQQLLISVRQSQRGNLNSGGLSTQGGITRGRVRVDGKPLDKRDFSSNTSVHKKTYTTKSHSNYQLRAVEGEPVYIQSGQEVPIHSRYSIDGQTAQQTHYKNVTSGFYVTAFVHDNTVTLHINSRSNQLNGNNIDTRELSTQLNANIGEWIELGAVTDTNDSTQRGVIHYQAGAKRDDASMQIKVEKF